MNSSTIGMGQSYSHFLNIHVIITTEHITFTMMLRRTLTGLGPYA